MIFYLNTTTGSGMVVTPSDVGHVVWGCMGTEITGADGTAIGSGQQNTIDILAGCSEAGIAAKLCADLSLGGYEDWHLPARDELNNLAANAEAVASNGEDFLNGQGYWSSTEGAGGADFAYAQDISSPGSAGNNSKTDSRPVRAVRTFGAANTPAPPVFTGFTFKGTFNNHHYYISNSTTLSWTQAKALADGTSGHLATIGSADENQFILNITSNEPGEPHAWIGFTDQDLEGTYSWVNGEAIVYTNWESTTSQPSNDGPDDDYTIMHSSNHFAPGSWGSQFNSVNVVANFELIDYNISGTINPLIGGNVSGTGIFNYGNTVELEATADPGYLFINWTEGETDVSTESIYSFEATSNRELVANFELIIGISNLLDQGLSFYPNPFQTELNISISSISNLSVLSVSDLTGKIISFRTNKGVDNITIDMLQSSSGIHFIHILYRNQVYRIKTIRLKKN